MRTAGIGLLGLVIGGIAGILLSELIARPIVGGDGDISTGLALLLGFIPPVLAIAGAVIAVKIDRGAKRSQ